MRPAKAVIDLAALRNNFNVAQQAAAPAKAIAVVKANAYGHGAVRIAQALNDTVPAFAVACIEEAIELRENDVTKPILLLEGAFEQTELALCAEHDFWIVVENDPQLEALLNSNLKAPLTVWVGIDSGMHRLGINKDNVSSYINKLEASPNVKGEVVLASHFASADELDNPMTVNQIAHFKASIDGYKRPTSLANSAAVMAWPDSHGDWVRPGYMLYGNSPLDRDHQNDKQLLPVMNFTSAIISIRDIAVGESVGYAESWTATRPSQVATVAIGYGDGYPRHAPSGTPVLVNGVRAKLVGRVSMDMITVDVTDLQDTKIGDEVTLWGPELSVNEVASCAGTIGYELLTRMPLRTPRVYVD